MPSENPAERKNKKKRREREGEGGGRNEKEPSWGVTTFVRSVRSLMYVISLDTVGSGCWGLEVCVSRVDELIGMS